MTIEMEMTTKAANSTGWNTARCKSFGQPRHWQEMVDTTGCMFVVQETTVRSIRPARLDDVLTITVDVRERGRASLRIAQQAWRGERLLAEGDIRIGCVERATMKPHRIPGPIFEAIE